MGFQNGRLLNAQKACCICRRPTADMLRQLLHFSTCVNTMHLPLQVVSSVDAYFCLPFFLNYSIFCPYTLITGIIQWRRSRVTSF